MPQPTQPQPTPKPGSAARGTRNGRPVMVLLDLLGRRWAMRIGWELRDGALGFRDLQARCGDISSSVLNDRLRELREAGILARGEAGYELTPRGRELIELLVPLAAWATRWARDQGAPGGATLPL